jgi:hypothetical protein
MGSFRNESTSCTWLLLCGVNTSCSCSANRSAFSLSLLAQSPGGVVNLRIGVDAGMGFILFFIRFQIELSCPVRFAI